MKEEKQIILCPDCDGYGKSKSVNKYSDNEMRLDSSLCKTCEGSGRLLRVVSYQLYDSKVDEATKLLSGEDETKYYDDEDEDEHVYAKKMSSIRHKEAYKMQKVMKMQKEDDLSWPGMAIGS